mgnify:CR=1 FL=1
MIPVTKVFLPPIEEYQAILQRAWDKGWITNRGELVLELEEKLKFYLQTEHILITNNGTIPLQIAIKALDLKGEIITTPFSYVATTSSIVWENCQPVFVDIHPEYLTIDETQIEAAITSRTTGIMATHVFGNPCDVETIEAIAQKYGLKVIYDAAHCFGVRYKGQSIFNFGDVSTCSFHATKLFHTGEGGALFARDKALQHKLYYSHNFGHNGPLDFYGLGINGKISELQAAMGLAVFPYLETILASRKKVIAAYDKELAGLPLQKLKIRPGTEWNYSYYPVIFENEALLLETQDLLNQNDVFPRRYFYPSLGNLNYVVKTPTPRADGVASRVFCLPLYHNMSEAEQLLVVNILQHVQKVAWL